MDLWRNANPKDYDPLDETSWGELPDPLARVAAEFAKTPVPVPVDPNDKSKRCQWYAFSGNWSVAASLLMIDTRKLEGLTNVSEIKKLPKGAEFGVVFWQSIA